MLKKFLACGLTFVMLLSNNLFTYAGESKLDSKQLSLGGVDYVVNKSVDNDGHVKVLVSGNGAEASVVNDGKMLNVKMSDNAGNSRHLNISLDNKIEGEKNNSLGRSFFRSSLYWDYLYLCDNNVSGAGLRWFLYAGSDNNAWDGYDYDNASVRRAAETFCALVNMLRNYQEIAAGKTYFCQPDYLAAIIKMIADADANQYEKDAAVLAIIEQVAASTKTDPIYEWFNAYIVSNDCKQAFEKFLAAVENN